MPPYPVKPSIVDDSLGPTNISKVFIIFKKVDGPYSIVYCWLAQQQTAAMSDALEMSPQNALHHFREHLID